MPGLPHLDRRQFLALLAAPIQPPPVVVKNSVLVHEHILVDFVGAAKANPKPL